MFGVKKGWKNWHAFAVVLVTLGLCVPAGAITTDHSHGSHNAVNSAVDKPAWLEKLENQVDHEELMGGMEGRQDKMDQTLMKVMDQLKSKLKEHASPASSGGGFHDSWSAHQLGQSYLLGPTEAAAKVYKGAHCPGNIPTRQFEVSAINVEVTLNQWGDYYPGYMYVLDKKIKDVRAEEAKNLVARERADALDPGAVSSGLQGDAIQPLTIRGNQGECVRVKFTNRLEDEDAGFQISGSAMIISSSGKPNTAAEAGSIVASGESQDYEWFIPVDEQEGSHMIQNHAGRDPSALGLIGAFIVEPRGSIFLDPWTGGPLESGWMAMIANDESRDFREFALFYHEVGDESFRPLNRQGEMIPQRDPLTDAYRPSARAMNFRSEPFGINNLAQQEKHFHYEDESLSYSSYTFADAPTTIPRSYLGDPAKFRLIHGGGEVFHSHHPHGGTIRWTRSPKREIQLENLTQAAYDGPVKYPVIRTTTDRVDVEVIGPAEALDLETECGSGLCQRLAGDFLFHCHVAHHYVAGMWGYWRVYNTLQDGNYPLGSTDIMRPLVELPDRAGRIPKGQTSDKLVGKTMDWFGKKFEITGSGKSDWSKETPVVNIKDWVKYMLPPKGQPGHTDDEKGQILSYDGSVWDYDWKGNQALSERESTLKKAKYISPRPGKRHPLQFDQHGKLAWPHMTPHFGKRVPFARNHGGAPWLEPFHMQTDTGVITKTESGSTRSDSTMENTGGAKPGEQGRWSLCPGGAGRKQYNLVFINTPIELSGAIGSTPPIIDKYGLIYVIDEEMAAVKADPKKAIPLVIRANVYDCVDVLLTSEWNDDDFTNFQMSKLNIHPHFFQFDNQASDGVISGFSYDQSMRSYKQFTKKMKDGHHVGMPVPMNAHVLKSTKPGDTKVEIEMAEHATPYHVGADIIVGIEVPNGKDARWITNITPDPNKGFAKDGKYTITFSEGMTHAHKAGQIVSTEYVRYRWWVDVDVGLVFWHDHAFGATTWPHGGIGSTIVEPWGSTYHNPQTGELIRSGPVADIHGTEPFAYGRNGSFREIVVQVHDTVPHTAQLVTEGNPPGLTRENAIAAGQSISFQMPSDMLEVAFPYLNGGTHTTGGGFNFRAASLSARLKANSDASKMFSSKVHGDPATPMLRAYVGDNIVFRLLHGMMNETHTFVVSGHGYRPERYDRDSRVTNALHIGIAERYDLATTAGGYQGMAGDYLYYDGRTSKLSEGEWGIIRVHDKAQSDLKVLPGNEGFAKKVRKTLCPKGAPVKSFSVVAINKALDFNANADGEIEVDFERKLLLANAEGKIFALEGEAKQAASDGHMPHPLTLRANIGDCVKIKLTNRLKKGNASLHANNIAFDPLDSQGINVGNNPGDQTVAPGKSKTYTFYAHKDYNINGALLWDFGNLTTNVRDGLFGGIIIGPRGSVYRDPETGKDISMGNSWKADVIIDKSYPENENIENYRDFALYFQDEDNILGTSFMPYLQNVAGLTGVNYRLEPWTYREDEGCELGNMLQLALLLFQIRKLLC